VAADVGIPEVLLPRAAGVLSAVGLLVSDVTHEAARSMVRPWGALEPADLEARFRDAERDGADRIPSELPIEHDRFLDVRYDGQSFDLRVSAPAPLDETALDTVADRFHDRHRERYGHAAPGEPLELVAVRVRTRGVVDPPALPPPDTDGDPDDAVRETRTVRFEVDRETPVYDRRRLPTGADLEGPAVVEGPDTTAVVRPDDAMTVLDDGTLRIEVDR